MPLDNYITGANSPSPISPLAGKGQLATASQAQTQTPVSGASVIPGASTYLGEESAAQKAYDDAQTQLLSQKNSLYHQYGLTSDGQVDANDPYGEYQTLLGTEGSALDSADNAALDRGLGTGGLAMQGEQSLRQGQGAEQLNFNQLVDSAGSQYAQGLATAGETRTQADIQAEADAAAAAANSGNYDTAPSPSSVQTSSATPAAKTAAAKTALVKLNLSAPTAALPPKKAAAKTTTTYLGRH